ncbi:MAG: ABC transporter permease subunit [Chitinivibrionales bacterium]|nr:ABC transporter permease subunit [Chitinivibrionales bacterium]
MRIFSDLTRERWRRFRRIKRAYISLILLGSAFVLSLFSEFIANDKPLYLRYHGNSYFPVLFTYSERTFGGRYKTEADYVTLRNDTFFTANAFMIFPPIAHDPLHSYLNLDDQPPHAPSWRHWLGTDAIARDILSRLIYGFRICMLFALMLMVLSAVLGIIIGGVQGYLGGKADITIQRLIEIWSSLPFLYVVILVGSIYGRNFALLLFVMAIFQWVGLSYYMRGEFYKLKSMTYVKSARAVGVGHIGILFKQILPNALTPVITIMPFGLISGISSLTALDFLGFGLPPPTPSWGELIQQGLANLNAPWIAVSTISALFITLLLTTFIGEGIREAFDPKAEYRLE